MVKFKTIKCSFYFKVIVFYFVINLSSPYFLFSQDCDINVTAVSTPSTCSSNGVIIASISGADVSFVDLANAQFRIQSVGSGYSTPFNKNGGVINDVPPGNYTVFVRAFCTKSGVDVTKQSVSVTVGGAYQTPNMFVVEKDVRKTLRAKVTGMIPVSFNKGKGPYKVIITSYPSEYIGPYEFSRNTEGVLEIESLPVGDYVLSLKDNCGYTLPELKVNVGKVASDFPSGFYVNPVYPFTAYVPSDCKKMRIYFRPNPLVSIDHELYPYLKDPKKYYDIILTEDENANENTGEIISVSFYNNAINQYIASISLINLSLLLIYLIKIYILIQGCFLVVAIMSISSSSLKAQLIILQKKS